jgi:hypothetical protein
MRQRKPATKTKPVAEDQRAKEAARSALFARLKKEQPMKAGRWTRDELYDHAQ